MTQPDPSRRQFISHAGALVAAAGAAALPANAHANEDKRALGGIHAIPALAPQWQSLDLAEVLKRPAAFMSVSAVKSLYEPWGAQASEKHWERGSLEAAVKVAKAARTKPNFKTFAWVGYEVFRQDYPQSDFDKAQYASWIKGIEDWPSEKQAKDNELAAPLAELRQPGDLEFNELALQTAFVGTQFPLELARKRIQVIVLTGIHLDWCIEGNSRAARDNGYLPIVIGDACGCQRPEQEAAAMDRINNFFAPVISAETFVSLLEA